MAAQKHQTNFPSEKIISVTDGAKCYIGYATSVTLKDSKRDTIIMGKTEDEVVTACLTIDPKMKVDRKLIHKVVMLQEKMATLDDEL